MGAMVLCAGCRGLMWQGSAIVSAWMKCHTAVAVRAGRAMCGGGEMLAEAPSPAHTANQGAGYVLEAVHGKIGCAAQWRGALAIASGMARETEDGCMADGASFTSRQAI